MHNKGFKDDMKRYVSLSVIIAYSCGLYCSPLLYFIITQQQLGVMARIKRTVRKTVGNGPRLPVDIVVAIAAEV